MPLIVLVAAVVQVRPKVAVPVLDLVLESKHLLTVGLAVAELQAKN